METKKNWRWNLHTKLPVKLVTFFRVRNGILLASQYSTWEAKGIVDKRKALLISVIIKSCYFTSLYSFFHQFFFLGWILQPKTWISMLDFKLPQRRLLLSQISKQIIIAIILFSQKIFTFTLIFRLFLLCSIKCTSFQKKKKKKKIKFVLILLFAQ